MCVNLPSLISDPSCVSSDKLISIFEFGKTGALSFKSSTSSSTLNNLKRLCGFVIISASKMQSGDSRRPHNASRSIGMRVLKSPLFSSISSRSNPFIIWKDRSEGVESNSPSWPFMGYYWSFRNFDKNGIFETKNGTFETKKGIFETKNGIFESKNGIFETKNGIFKLKMVHFWLK